MLVVGRWLVVALVNPKGRGAGMWVSRLGLVGLAAVPAGRGPGARVVGGVRVGFGCGLGW